MDYSKIINMPEFQALPPEQKEAVLKAAGVTPSATPTSMPAPTAAPSSPMDLSPGQVTSPLNYQPLAGPTAYLENLMAKTKRGLHTGSESVFNTLLGTTGGAAMSGAVNPMIDALPSNIPEAVGDVLLATGNPEEVGLRPLLKRLVAPPAGAALTAMATGSKRTTPGEAAAYTGLGGLGGEILGAGQKLALGGAGSRRIKGILDEDLRKAMTTLAGDLPDVVPSTLSRPSDVLNYFQKDPDQIWKHMLLEADGKTALAKRSRAMAKNMPIGPKQWQLALADQREQEAAKIMAEYNARAKPFLALKKFFGQKTNFQGYGEGYKDLVLDTLGLQNYLGKSQNITAMRRAGVSEDAINNLRAVAFGAPLGTPEEVIMEQRDVPPEALAPGFRLHYYHALPRPITHVNMPRPAKLAGTRQLQLNPSPYWQKFGSPLMARLGYGLFGTYGDEEEAPTSDNTFMPK